MMTAVIEIMMVQYKEIFVIGFSKVITLVECRWNICCEITP